MEFLKRRVSSLLGLRVGERIGFLFVLSSLNENLERSYLRLCQEQECKSLVVTGDNYCTKQSTGNKNNHRALEYFSTFRRLFKVYTSLANYLLAVNFIKYLLVSLFLETKLWQTLDIGDWSCYLPGRYFLHKLLVDVTLVLGISLVVQILVWRYIAARSQNHYELLNMMIFLMADDELINQERSRVRAINSKNQLIRKNGGRTGSELDSLLQKALFYKLTTTDGLIAYKLRPNRSKYYKKQLSKYVDRLYIVILFLITFCILLLVPIIIQAWHNDISYARTYPSCCQPGRLWIWPFSSVSLNDGFYIKCGQRLYTIVFDLLDSSTIIIGYSTIYLSTSFLSTIITASLVLHWKLIDRRIMNLLRRYKQVAFERRPTVVLPTSRQKFRAPERLKSNQTHLLDYEVADLQAIIIDFFTSFRKINRLAGSLIGYTFLLFIYSILVVAYFSYKIPGYSETLISKYFLIGLYVMFFANSLMVLELNRVVNKSYPNICSLMAANGSTQSEKWIRIVDIFSNRLDTSYSILGWRLNWHLVTSMMASSLSFLFLVESYRRKNIDLLRM